MRPIDADALIEFCAERWIPLNIDAVNMQPTIQPVATDTNVGDTISRQAAIDGKIIIQRTNGVEIYYDEAVPVGYLKRLPSVQPEPQEGHWIQYDKRFPWRHHYKCSECGNYLDFTGVNGGMGEANFCPNCGAKMKGEQDGH